MKSKKDYLREYQMETDRNYVSFTFDELIFKIKNPEKFIKRRVWFIVADGGIGKTYISKKMKNKLGWKWFYAGNMNHSDIKNKVIIDGFDEVEPNWAKKTLDQIIAKDIKDVVIFTRPENIDKSFIGSAHKINIINNERKNPRFDEFSVKSSETFIEDMEKTLFGVEFNHKKIETDFLSLLAFKLLTEGKIQIEKNKFFEFTRIYNINNGSSFNIIKGDFKNCLEESYDFFKFKNKTIVSFYVTKFLEKFYKSNNGYLNFFKNSQSQAALTEAGNFLWNSKNERHRDIVCELMWKYDYIFIFSTKWRDIDSIIKTFNEKGKSWNDVTIKLSRWDSMWLKDQDSNNEMFFWNSFNIKKINWDLYFNLLKYCVDEFLFKKRYNQIIEILFNVFTKKEKENVSFLKKIKTTLKKHLPKEVDFNSLSLKIKSVFFDLNKPSFLPNEIDFLKTNSMDEPFIKAYLYYKTKKETSNYIEWNQKNNRYDFVGTNFLKLTANDSLKLLDLISDNYNGRGKERIIFSLVRKITEDNNPPFSESEPELILDFLKRRPTIKELIFNNNQYQQKIKVTCEFYKKLESLNGKADKSFYYTNEIVIKEEKIGINKLEERVRSLNFKEMFVEKNHFNELKEVYKEGLKELVKMDLKPIEDKVNNFLKKLRVINDLKPLDEVLQVIYAINKKSIVNINKNVYFFIDNIKFNIKNNYEWFPNKKRVKSSHVDWYNEIPSSEIKKYYREIISDYSRFEECMKNGMEYYIYQEAREFLLRSSKKIQNDYLKIIKKYGELEYYWFETIWKLNNKYEEKILENIKIEEKDNPVNSFFKIDLLIRNGLEDKKIIIRYLNKVIENFVDGATFMSGTVHWWRDVLSGRQQNSSLLKFLKLVKTHGYLNDLKDMLMNEYEKNLKNDYSYREFLDITNSFTRIMFEIKAQGLSINLENYFKNIIDDLDSQIFKKVIHNIWYWYTGSFLINSGVEFNIKHYYSFLNSTIDSEKFKFIFINEILPKIEQIAQSVWNKKSGKNELETKIHKELNKVLPNWLLINKQVMYMSEVNPHTPLKDKQRVDILLNSSNYYIAIELKVGSDSRNTNGLLEQQLQNYTKSQLVPTINYLILFEDQNHGADKIKKIEKICLSNNYKLERIKLIKK